MNIKKGLIIIIILFLSSCGKNEISMEQTASKEVQPTEIIDSTTDDKQEPLDLIEVFKSEIFVEQIKKAISKNRDITYNDLKYVKDISISRNMDDDIRISGIRYLENIENLLLESGMLNDFDELEYLSSLREFEVHGMNITSLDALVNSQNLKSLKINGNKIEDTSGLAKIQSIEELNIDFSELEITILSKLENLKKLTVYVKKTDEIKDLEELNLLSGLDIILDLSFYRRGDDEIKEIVNVDNIKGLILDDAYLNDCSILVEFTELEILSANYSRLGNDNDFTNIISMIPSLRYVYIDYSSAYSVDFVKYLPNLQELNISQMENCKDFSPLSKAVYLKSLTINASLHNLDDISFIKGMSMLTSLDMELNGLNNIDDLCCLTNLKYLNLGLNNIENLTAISELHSLEELYLFGNGIKDISAIYGFENLTELVLSDNQIIDISTLSSLTNLEILNLENNYVVDISAIKNLEKLKYINIENNPIQNTELLNEIGFEYMGDGVYYRYFNNPNE